MLPNEEYSLISSENTVYRYADGILFSYSKSILRTIKNISANIELVKKITDNKPVPLMILFSYKKKIIITPDGINNEISINDKQFRLNHVLVVEIFVSLNRESSYLVKDCFLKLSTKIKNRNDRSS